MKSRHFKVAAVILLPLGLGALAPSSGCVSEPSLRVTSADEPGREWIAHRSDNVCGLDKPWLVSNPALVQYALVFDLTPEMRKLREEGIDPESATGIQLRQRAGERVRDECEFVRAARGHCSVWKQIRHRDGRSVPDVTSFVEERIRAPR